MQYGEFIDPIAICPTVVLYRLVQIKRVSFVGIWKTILFVVAGMIVGIVLSDPALFGDVLRDEPGAAELDMIWGGVIGAIAGLVISTLVRRNKANG